MDNRLVRLSKFLCVVLRHDPSAAGIEVNEHGWARADAIIEAFSRRGPFDRETLEEIVRNDNKSRYAFSADGSMIRCNHGHTIRVDLELPASRPPEYLLHGTGDVCVSSIDREGLRPGARMYVHMTDDERMAVSVGARHGRPVVYRVKSGAMARDGFEFFQSASGIWLTEHVPAEYIEKTFDECRGG